MATQPVPQWLMNWYTTEYNGQFSFNRFFYHFYADVPTDPTQAQVDTARTTFEALIIASILPCLSQDVTVIEVGSNLRTDTLLIESTNLVSETGTVVHNALPYQDCAVITWEYAVTAGTRVTRGKTFVSGISEDDEEGGELDPGIYGLLDNMATQLALPCTIGGTVADFSIWRPSVPGWVKVSGHYLQPVIKTLRSRRPGS